MIIILTECDPTFPTYLLQDFPAETEMSNETDPGLDLVDGTFESYGNGKPRIQSRSNLTTEKTNHKAKAIPDDHANPDDEPTEYVRNRETPKSAANSKRKRRAKVVRDFPDRSEYPSCSSSSDNKGLDGLKQSAKIAVKPESPLDPGNNCSTSNSVFQIPVTFKICLQKNQVESDAQPPFKIKKMRLVCPHCQAAVTHLGKHIQKVHVVKPARLLRKKLNVSRKPHYCPKYRLAQFTRVSCLL